jgi:tyrosyl-tRNA synthetase
MKRFAYPNEQLEVLLRGVVDVVEREELLAKLARSADQQKPLTVMAGFDPTSPDLHLGHTVLLRKMRQFQELGHEVIFLIGDFTATVGDPSWQERSRAPLSPEQVAANARTYEDQVERILDPAHTRVEYNSHWLKELKVSELLKFAEHILVQRLASRNDLAARPDLHLHELIYPVLQAYDAIHLNVDVEIGGEDQLPNLLLARELMTEVGVEPLCVLATELLEGTDATLQEGKFVGRKMSKSFGNTIGISERPEEIRRKVHLLNDGLVWRYLELLTDASMPQIKAYQADVEAGKRAMDAIKEVLAEDLIRMYHRE